MNELAVHVKVYVALLALTALTVASAMHGAGRLLAVVLAVAVASMKASLIAYHYMQLKREGLLIYAVVLSGALAVIALAAGILPDIALNLQ